MKKSLCLLFAVFALSSCGAGLIDPLSKCESSATKYTDALSEFAADYTNKKKCEAFKDATTTYLNACTTTLSSGDVKAAKDAINSFDCNDL